MAISKHQTKLVSVKTSLHNSWVYII